MNSLLDTASRPLTASLSCPTPSFVPLPHHLPAPNLLKTICAPLWVTPLSWSSAAVAKELLISPEPPRCFPLGSHQMGSQHRANIPCQLSSTFLHTLLPTRKGKCQLRLLLSVSQKTPFMNLQLITPQAVYLTPNIFSHAKETTICTRRSGLDMATFFLEAAIWSKYLWQWPWKLWSHRYVKIVKWVILASCSLLMPVLPTAKCDTIKRGTSNLLK